MSTPAVTWLRRELMADGGPRLAALYKALGEAVPRAVVHSRTYSTMLASDRVDFLGDERGHMTIPTHAGALLIIDDRAPDDGCLHPTLPYLAKCKRLRTDGPTPCLCCPGECVGDAPGYTYAQALLAKSYVHTPASLPWYMWLFIFGPTVGLLLGLYAKLRGWW